ncbi:MAG: hypothetical protein U5N86_12065 [Planctomycetota bacterium]|nr:hypothetical protein [Planctomycetota bacterium]
MNKALVWLVVSVCAVLSVIYALNGVTSSREKSMRAALDGFAQRDNRHYAESGSFWRTGSAEVEEILEELGTSGYEYRYLEGSREKSRAKNPDCFVLMAIPTFRMLNSAAFYVDETFRFYVMEVENDAQEQALRELSAESCDWTLEGEELQNRINTELIMFRWLDRSAGCLINVER